MNNWRAVRPVFFLLLGSMALMTAGCGAPVAVAGASYATDGTLLATSNKTSSDHLASIVSKKDCAFMRAFQGRPICKEREGDKDPYDVDYTHAERMVAEDGVHYVPPLRPAADAPATSWTAAAYDQAPPPQAKPVARASSSAIAPAPSKKATPAKKKTAAQKKPVKKPSQDQAASGS
jgi:hypothetical protein